MKPTHWIQKTVNKASRLAFSLVEMVGVMAIIAVLAAVILPVVIKRLDIAARSKEISDLSSISNAVTLQIMRTYSIPNQANWAQSAADWLNRPVNQITSNNRNYQRYLLIDPNLGPAGFSLPYTQGFSNGVASTPSNARFILVSTLARGNAPLTSGATLNASDFNALWNTPAGQKPSIWGTNFAGGGDDVCIQRINLEPLFFQLILNNRDTFGLARFSINTNISWAVPSNGLNSFYLDGTVVGLCDSNGVPATRYILKKNSSFVFENGAWYGQILNGPPLNTNLNAVFTSTANAFFNSMWYTNAANGNQTTDQGAVIGSMVNFMLDYTMWANDNPHFNDYNVGNVSNLKNKLQIWVLLDREGIGDASANDGNLKNFSAYLLNMNP